MKRGKITALVSLILCLILGISGLSVGVVKAVEDTEEGIELTTTDQVILEGDGNETVTNEEEALQYFIDHAANYGIADAEDTLVLQDASEAAGYQHYSFVQVYNDIPVYGNCLNIMTDAEDGTVLMSTGVYRDIDEKVDLTAGATKDDIIASIEENFMQKGGYEVVTAVNVTDSAVTAENLVIYAGDKEDVLAYEFDASFKADEEYMNYHMLADAQTGEILDGWSNIYTETVQIAADASGIPVSVEGKTTAATGRAVEIEVYYDEKEQVYYLQDEIKKIKVYDIQGNDSNDKRFDVWNNYNQFSVRSTDKDSWDVTGVGLLYRLEMTHERYKEILGINGFNNENGKILAGYNDGWDSGNNAYCSSGEGINDMKIAVGSNRDIAKEWDIIAHEYSHAVQMYVKHLEYKGEAGAIMEAYADTMGEIIEGDKSWYQSVGRNIAEPSKSSNPTKIGDSNYQDPTDSYDNGGVHQNSTILSHASYLMNSYGMTDKDIAKLWYESIRSIPKSDITFQEFGWLMYKKATVMSKNEDLESRDVVCVGKALQQVGIEFEQIIITVDCDFDCLIKDYFDVALDDAKVEFYELNFSADKWDDKGNDGRWHIQSKPIFTIESTDNNAIFKPKHLEEGSFYQIKISDNKYPKEEVYSVFVHCVSNNKHVNSLIIGTQFRKDIVTDFALQDDEVDLAVDELKYIEPIITPWGISSSNYTITWQSSDEDIVTIDKDGKLKGIDEGTATITATLKNKERTFTGKTTVTVTKKQRDTILVLDCSGSMSGKPMAEMKQAATKFCEAMLNAGGDNRIEIISYDNGTQKSGFMDNLSSMESYISKLSAGGETNTCSAMKLAVSELTASARKSSVQNIVIMSDGVPNNGDRQNTGVMTNWVDSNGRSVGESGYGNAVCAYYDAYMKSDYDVYSLGFFHSLRDTEKAYCSYLMNYIQNSGYYEVDDADNLQISFGTISGQVNNGSKIVITVACPVDVSVSLNGETLSSSRVSYNGSTSFGTLKRTGAANDIKVLELDSTNDYDISFEGNGSGTMDYTVTYYGSDDSIEETRNFASVPVSASTRMTSNTVRTEEMQLQIDTDGDGQIDSIWTASADSDGEETFRDENMVTAEVTATAVDMELEDETEKSNDSKAVWIVLIICSSVIILASVISIVIVAVKKVPEGQNTQKGNKKQRNHNLVPACAVVVPLDGSMRGKQLSFKTGQVYVVGKDASKADVVIDPDFQGVSRLHCTIQFDERNNGYYITDYSSNGTYLMNSKRRLEKGRRMLIARNTVIYLAKKDCRIELK